MKPVSDRVLVRRDDKEDNMRDTLKEIFKSDKFASVVKKPFLFLFTQEHPPIENSIWECDGHYIYIGQDCDSSHSAAYSLIIEILKDGHIMIHFDDDNGFARYKEEEVMWSDGWIRRSIK